MRRDAQIRQWIGFAGLVEAFENFEVAGRIIDEAALAGGRRLSAKAAISIESRQQGDGDAGVLGGRETAQGKLGRLLIRRAVRLMMQILEFADDGRAAF